MAENYLIQLKFSQGIWEFWNDYASSRDIMVEVSSKNHQDNAGVPFLDVPGYRRIEEDYVDHIRSEDGQNNSNKWIKQNPAISLQSGP